MNRVMNFLLAKAVHLTATGIASSKQTPALTVTRHDGTPRLVVNGGRGVTVMAFMAIGTGHTAAAAGQIDQIQTK